MVKTVSSWQYFSLCSSAPGTVTLRLQLPQRQFLVSIHLNEKIAPSFFFYLKFCQMCYKNTFDIFIDYFLLVAVLIPSRGRAMYLFPNNKNWKLLLMTLNESFDPQELFPNESLTWIMSHLYSKSAFCVTSSISLTSCWWKESLVMYQLKSVFIGALSTMLFEHYNPGFLLSFFSTCSQFLFLNVLQSLLLEL